MTTRNYAQSDVSRALFLLDVLKFSETFVKFHVNYPDIVVRQ